MTTNKFLILTDDSAPIGVLDSFEAVKVHGRNLREGMIVLEPDLNCAVAVLDHRVRATRGTGSAKWLCEIIDPDLIDRMAMVCTGYRHLDFHLNTEVLVAARRLDPITGEPIAEAA